MDSKNTIKLNSINYADTGSNGNLSSSVDIIKSNVFVKSLSGNFGNVNLAEGSLSISGDFNVGDRTTFNLDKNSSLSIYGKNKGAYNITNAGSVFIGEGNNDYVVSGAGNTLGNVTNTGNMSVMDSNKTTTINNLNNKGYLTVSSKLNVNSLSQTAGNWNLIHNASNPDSTINVGGNGIQSLVFTPNMSLGTQVNVTISANKLRPNTTYVYNLISTSTLDAGATGTNTLNNYNWESLVNFNITNGTVLIGCEDGVFCVHNNNGVNSLSGQTVYVEMERKYNLAPVTLTNGGSSAVDGVATNIYNNISNINNYIENNNLYMPNNMYDILNILDYIKDDKEKLYKVASSFKPINNDVFLLNSLNITELQYKDVLSNSSNLKDDKYSFYLSNTTNTGTLDTLTKDSYIIGNKSLNNAIDIGVLYGLSNNTTAMLTGGVVFGSIDGSDNIYNSDVLGYKIATNLNFSTSSKTPFNTDITLLYNSNNYTTARNVNAMGSLDSNGDYVAQENTNTKNESKQTVNTILIGLSLGFKNYNLVSLITVSPKVYGNYSIIKMGSYNEKNSSASLGVEGFDVNVVDTGLSLPFAINFVSKEYTNKIGFEANLGYRSFGNVTKAESHFLGFKDFATQYDGLKLNGIYYEGGVSYALVTKHSDFKLGYSVKVQQNDYKEQNHNVKISGTYKL